MKSIFLAASAALVVASPVAAREFNGPYVGAGATLDNVQGSGPAEGLGANGVGGTVFAGYDIAMGKTFAGLEANADIYSADVDLGGATAKADWGWGIGGRVGYKLNEGTALYGRLGYARARASAGGFHEWADGVRYGAGIETSLSSKVSLRAELSQFNYEQDVINNQVSLSLAYGF
ncbi:outer membrane protein [Novosphingobium olei]|uniref:Porin family protein n=1 Tax=Novosphingobium olei TaxID=2728851 RepID=A0A7Y0BR83_9SPHN|nr:outer membrane beta-barrel protein [Novosphingobium olei]NML95126.1 porin family protein [Novosphingobium olei]